MQQYCGHSRRLRAQQPECHSARGSRAAWALLAGFVAFGASACGAPPEVVAEEDVMETAEAVESAMDRKPVAAAALAVGSDVHIWVAVRSTNNRLYRRVLRRSDMTWLTGWDLLDSGTADVPTVHTFGSQEIVIYVRGTDNHLWQLWYPDARDPSNSSAGWGDVTVDDDEATDWPLIGQPTAAGKSDRLAVFSHVRAPGDGSEVGYNLVHEWNHPDAPGRWHTYFFLSSGDGYTNTFSADDDLEVAVQARSKSDHNEPQLITRNFFPSDSGNDYTTKSTPTFRSQPVNGSAAVTASSTGLRVFFRSGLGLKRINYSSDGSTTGWVQNGTCTNVRSSPSLGSEGNMQTPYFACTAPNGSVALCKQPSNNGCTLIGGVTKSAPTVVSNHGGDVVFYKGGNNNVFMYTTAQGHQDLGLALP